MPCSKVILVTGASSGIGREIALLLAQHGYTVYGTSRKPDSAITGIFEMLPLDVTSDASVKTCVDTVLEREGQLDVLVNNAGTILFGALEEISIDEAKWIFETNFFGVSRMVNAVLPTMRRQKSGYIVNISSLGGLTGTPFHGYYGASKHALEGYSEALRHELHTLGIHVSLIEPGFFKSDIDKRKLYAAKTIEDYTKRQTRLNKRWEIFSKYAPHSRPVAKTVLKAVESERPKMRYPVGLDALWGGNIKRFIPYSLYEFGVRVWLNLHTRRDIIATAWTLGGALAAGWLWRKLVRRR